MRRNVSPLLTGMAVGRAERGRPQIGHLADTTFRRPSDALALAIGHTER